MRFNATLLQLVLSLLRRVLSVCYVLLQLFDESIQLSNALPRDEHSCNARRVVTIYKHKSNVTGNTDCLNCWLSTSR
jgi:hypothetical protein